MSNHLYKFNGSIGPMTNQQLVDGMLGIERSSRSGSFTYSAEEMFQTQIEEMKSWPADVKEHVKASAKAIREAQPSISKNGMIRAAVAETLAKFVAPGRATKKDRIGTEFEAKAAAGDMALSMLFKRAPSVEATLSPRQYTDKPQKFLAKVSDEVRKLCVNIEDIDKADVYVSALYNEQLGRAFLIGYATKEDLKKAKKGNRLTDPENCPWQRMCYYMPHDELKPLGMIMKHFGLTDIPEGVVFERVMLPESLPLPACRRKATLDLFSESVVDGTDFNELLGLEPKKTSAPVMKPEPMEEVLPMKPEEPKAAAPKANAENEFAF